MTNFSSWSGQVFEKNLEPSIHFPHTLEHVVSLIKLHSTKKNKIRVSGSRHSWNSIILSDSSIYLSTSYLKEIGPIEWKNGQAVITVEAGVKLGELSDHLFALGYSLGFAMPEFRGLTIAGLLATGSHGSSRRHPAVSNQIVSQIQVVTAEGVVLNLRESDGDLFRVANVNLGVMGVITQVQLKLVPKFNLQMTTSVLDLEKNSLVDFVQAKPDEDFLFVMWFPKLKKAIIESGIQTNGLAEEGAENVIFGLHHGVVDSDYKTSQVLAQGRQDLSGNIDAAIEAKRFEGLVQKPRFVVKIDGHDVNKDSVVGQANKMLLGRGDTIIWPYKLSNYSFCFPASGLADVMATVETFSNTKNYSFPNAGISFRFVHSDGFKSSLLSHFEDGLNSGQLLISADFLEYRPFNLQGSSNDSRDDLRNELLDILAKKHSVRFHFGKNDDRIFKVHRRSQGPAEEFSRFRKVIQETDPNGIFMTEFVSQIVKI